MTTQTEEVAITEEDLELIKDRETNIRQLEVRLCQPVFIINTYSYKIHCHTELSVHFFVSVWHHGCQPDLQGPGSYDPWSGRNDWWVAVDLCSKPPEITDAVILLFKLTHPEALRQNPPVRWWSLCHLIYFKCINSWDEWRCWNAVANVVQWHFSFSIQLSISFKLKSILVYGWADNQNVSGHMLTLEITEQSCDWLLYFTANFAVCLLFFR